jgi:hypothetical protein
MLAFITGHAMERFSLAWAKVDPADPVQAEVKLKELRCKLCKAFAEQRCVTTGTLRPTLPGLRGGHAYAVLGFNAEADTIRVWDPHGDSFTPKHGPSPQAGYARNGGICELPLAVFVKQFAGLAFELLNAVDASPSHH